MPVSFPCLDQPRGFIVLEETEEEPQAAVLLAAQPFAARDGVLGFLTRLRQQPATDLEMHKAESRAPAGQGRVAL